jgi:hypothetical protein
MTTKKDKQIGLTGINKMNRKNDIFCIKYVLIKFSNKFIPLK